MGEWKVKRIDELGKISRGRSRHRPRDDKSLYGGEYPFVQTGDVKASEFYLSKYSQTYNEKGLAQSKLWEKGTLCITIAANIAETAILDIDACFPDSIVGFIPYDDEADVRFVKYSFDMLKKEMQLASLGATQDNFSVEKMLKFKFVVPDFQKQKKIADILSAYDDLIENNNLRIELLEKAAQELYKEWFVRFRFPNHENTKFVNGLPEGWNICKIGTLYNTSSGGTPSRANPQFYTGGKYDWIKTGELCDRFILDTEEKITEEAVKNSSAKIIPENSLILAMYGATIGKMGFTTKQATCNQACCVFKPQKDYGSKYLYFWLLNNREYVISIGFGAAQQNLSQDLIKNIKMLQPTESTIKLFEERVDPIFTEIKILLRQNQNLKKQRDLLLPRLMSGKLEV